MTVLFVAALEEETVAFPADAPILHVGVGKVQAAARLAHHLAVTSDRPNLIINIGTAGGLQGQPLATVIEVGTVHQHDFDQAGVSAFVGRDLEGGPITLSAPAGTVARLTTGDRIVTTERDRRDLAATADLVDMEGYAIAAVATRFGIPVRIVKAVSDAADDETFTTWTGTLRHCSDALVGWLAERGILDGAHG